MPLPKRPDSQARPLYILLQHHEVREAALTRSDLSDEAEQVLPYLRLPTDQVEIGSLY